MSKIDLSKLKKLENSGSQLDPTKNLKKEIQNHFFAYAEKFLETITSSKAFDYTTYDKFELIKKPFQDDPIEMDDIIEDLKQNVDSRGINPASGGHMGYIPGGGIFSSAVGDYLAAIFNRYAGVYFSSPGAVEIEEMIIQWTASIVGFQNCVGNLTSGGSIATLIAIGSARKNKKITSKNYHKAVVYLTNQTHHAFEKALSISGMEDANVRNISVDENFRMDPIELKKAIEKDKNKGFIPWMVVGSAGTTNTGSIDKLDELHNIAKANNLWYHIDAAYGGYFAMVENAKSKFKGIEDADSVVLDPHKGLSVPFGLGIVLVKDRNAILDAHRGNAHYMQDADHASHLISPSETSPELSKHFRGLRLWLPLKIHGTKPFRDNLEEKLLLAQYFHQEISKMKGFEVGPKPALSVVIFRYLPRKGNSNEFNKRLIEEIHKDGRIFLTSTILNKKFTLRIAIVSFRTHKNIIDQTLNILKEKVELLER